MDHQGVLHSVRVYALGCWTLHAQFWGPTGACFATYEDLHEEPPRSPLLSADAALTSVVRRRKGSSYPQKGVSSPSGLPISHAISGLRCSSCPLFRSSQGCPTFFSNCFVRSLLDLPAQPPRNQGCGVWPSSSEPRTTDDLYYIRTPPRRMMPRCVCAPAASQPVIFARLQSSSLKVFLLSTLPVSTGGDKYIKQSFAPARPRE
ncbi:hypothetical protein RB213_005811 [Colletotrichum asianum]